MDPQSLYASPNALAPHYSRFRVAERVLLTGHSHQAWPDCGLDGQRAAWLDAAEWVDEKWERAFAQADRVRRGYADRLGDTDGEIALAGSTHELVVRLLSALPLERRPRLLSTDGEFHSIRRQLARLAEVGVEVHREPARPTETLAERLAETLDGRTAAVLVSSVLFERAEIVPGLGHLAEACEGHGTTLLVDAYHHLNAVPFDLGTMELASAFVVGGGYKYMQLGEGNCFMRVPPGCELRPVITGWYAEFGDLAEARGPGTVAYAAGAGRFAGATYDPTSHYRAAAVLDFLDDRGLQPELLRRVSRHQVALLAGRFDALDLHPGLLRRDRSLPLERIGGFLALESPRATEICAGLGRRGVKADTRGRILRLGPAPYLCDVQLEAAVDALAETARELGA